MPDTEICPECRVPKHITSEHVWLENGVIGSKRDETHRLVFFESGILDPIFDGIDEITGKPIEDLVIKASRLSTRENVSRMLPEDRLGIYDVADHGVREGNHHGSAL